MLNLSFRQFAAIGVMLCALLMATALYFQHGMGLEPCPLCVLQRIALISLGIVLLIAALHGPNNSIFRQIYAGLAALAAIIGAGIAGWHVWLQNLPADKVPDCGPGFDYIMSVFSVFEGLQMIFQGSGECAEIDWQFLTLTMPAWTLVIFIVAFVVSVYVMCNQVKFK